MGILNRTPDSFFDRGATFRLDDLLTRAEQLVIEGADLLDIGGVKAGPGPEVTEAEELDRLIPAIEGLHRRLDIALSADTWRAAVLDEACNAGAVVGNDISGFADPDYLAVAAKHDASVVATHIRLQPRVPDPDPHYDDLVADVHEFLLERATRAESGGARARPDRDRRRPRSRQDAEHERGAARESDVLAASGFTLLLSASNKRFLGDLLDLAIDQRREASLAAVAYGVAHGCRIVRVHDVAGSVRVCRTIEAVLAAGDAE